MRVCIGELIKVAEATPSKGEISETENSKVEKPKNSVAKSESELSAETSSATLDKSDAGSAYDMQTVRQTLRSPEESIALSKQTSNVKSRA